MPVRLRMLHIPPGHRPTASIRETLERDAWRDHPGFATRMARRRQRIRAPRRRLRWQDRVLLIIAVTLMTLLLVRIETARADAPWGMEFTGGGFEGTSVALETRIRIDVTGLLARVEVDQVFVHSGDAWAEAVYRFPLPDGAAVDRMRMRVGERVLEGQIRERVEARRIYQQARAEGRTASLVEQQRPNQYESRLANIGPGERIEVTIGFLATVSLQDGRFSLRLPMTFTSRWGPPESAPGLTAAAPSLVGSAAGVHRALELEVMLRTRTGYAVVESRYHDVDIEPVPAGYRVTLSDAAQLPDRDFELGWIPDFGAHPRPEVLTWDGGDAIYAQLMITPPLAAALRPEARDVVFILDTSGSMHGASLGQAVAALVRGLEALQPDDYFNVIQFNSATELLYDSSVPTDALHLQQARDYLAGLRADGGTVMAPALAAALELPPTPGVLRQVVFITDGSVSNEHELLLQIAEQLGEARLFTVAIGSAPISWFMRNAAEVGRGSHTHIGRLDEVEQRMTDLWQRIRLPALSAICVDWGAEAEYYPEVIPDLYAGDLLFLVARLPLMPREIEICGQLNGTAWTHRVTPHVLEGSEALATLWARKKIEALEDSLVFGADPQWVRDRVTRLALTRGLLTRYTSMVVAERTPARPPGEALQSAPIPSLLPAGSTRATAAFPATATGWPAQLLLSLLTLLIATGLFLLSGARLPLGSSTRASGASPG